MADWRVPVADVALGEGDVAAVADVLRSGWLTMGPRTEGLEAALAAYVGAQHAIAVASGTAALHLACAAAGLGPGDEAVVPSMTFVATANAVAYTGARPVFADVLAADAPWLGAAACERALTPRTRAILAVDYGGATNGIAELAALARDRGLILIEDAAHALGASVDGRAAGRLGALGTFSFFSSKNVPAGEGGAVVTDDGELAERVRLLRSHGMTSGTWQRHRARAGGYDVVALGFNYRIDEPRAALAQRRLAALEEGNAARARLAARYAAELRGVRGLALLADPEPGHRSAHHLFCVLLDPGADREAFRRALAARGVQTSIHFPPVHRLALYAGERHAPLPATDAYGARTVTLPLFPHMTAEQQDLVVAAVREALA